MSAVHRALEWRDASADDRARYRELERSVIAQAALVRDACHSEPCTEAGLTSAFTAFLDRRLPGAAGHAARTRVRRAGPGHGASAWTPPPATWSARPRRCTSSALALLPQPLRQPAETLDRSRSRAGAAPSRRRVRAAVVDAGPGRSGGAWSGPRTSASTARGHPRGLSGLEIPMGARLVAVACAVDRIATGDAGRPGLSGPAAEAALAALAGTALDPDLVRVWARQAERALAAR